MTIIAELNAADVEQASVLATEALDKSFLRIRFDRLPPRKQQYLRAMAFLGPPLPGEVGAFALPTTRNTRTPELG